MENEKIEEVEREVERYSPMHKFVERPRKVFMSAYELIDGSHSPTGEIIVAEKDVERNRNNKRCNGTFRYSLKVVAEGARFNVMDNWVETHGQMSDSGPYERSYSVRIVDVLYCPTETKLFFEDADLKKWTRGFLGFHKKELPGQILTPGLYTRSDLLQRKETTYSPLEKFIGEEVPAFYKKESFRNDVFSRADDAILVISGLNDLVNYFEKFNKNVVYKGSLPELLKKSFKEQRAVITGDS